MNKIITHQLAYIIILFCMYSLGLIVNPTWAEQRYTPKLVVLEEKYGFRIELPKDWIETPIGVIHPPHMLFSYIWHPPSPARFKDKKAELRINVLNNPSKNLHLRALYYPKVWHKEVNEAGGIFIDLQTGLKAKDDSESVKSLVFWNEKQGLMGCWFASAYLWEDRIVEAGANVYTEQYLIQVRLLIDSKDYPRYAATFNKILNSIRINFEGWQRPIKR